LLRDLLLDVLLEVLGVVSIVLYVVCGYKPCHKLQTSIFTRPCRFLRYEPFNHPKYFKQHIKEEIAHNPAKGFRKLQALLRAVLLRRTKGSKIGSQPIIALPERRQQMLKIEFSRDESAFYKQVGIDAA
jgi:SNF2 family DNA or RNA helicase